jgi:hypothetical protein
MELRTESSTEETKPEPERPELMAFAHDGFTPGMHIGNGDAKEKVLRRFGKPNPTDRVQSTIQGEPRTVGLFYTKYWYYDGLEIRLGQPVGATNTWVRQIILTSPDYRLKFGLSIGAKRSQFLAVLGAPYQPSWRVKPTGDSLIYSSEYEGSEDGVAIATRSRVHIFFDDEYRAEKIVWEYLYSD